MPPSVGGQKAKGEEKPEEELMGKRKSSPRLATTSVRDAVTNSMAIKSMSIHGKRKFPF